MVAQELWYYSLIVAGRCGLTWCGSRGGPCGQSPCGRPGTGSGEGWCVTAHATSGSLHTANRNASPHGDL